ncbi:hypothetical protein Tco_0994900 [Tanacetum coccineum]
MTGTIAEPVLEEYITVTRKNYISENDGGKIIEESFLEIKGSRLRLSVFPVSLTGAASEWFREECIGSVTTWEEQHGVREVKKNNDQKGTTFGRVDEGANNNREPYDDRIEDSENENKVAKIFRIETDVFNYESTMCKAFDEFNYLLKIDTGVLTKDIPGFKTYEQFKNDWIYKWNDKIPWDHKWYKALVDCKLKHEALRNKAELEKLINQDGESSDDAWSNNSPIDEWSDQGEGDCAKLDVDYNPYLDIAQLFNSHTNKEGGGDNQ